MLNSDDTRFGGFGRISEGQRFFSSRDANDRPYIKIYNINRAALVLERETE